MGQSNEDTNISDGQNTAEGTTEKNPGARPQDREAKVFSLCGARLCDE
jgi:hypothetical protein